MGTVFTYDPPSAALDPQTPPAGANALDRGKARNLASDQAVPPMGALFEFDSYSRAVSSERR
jgi:hypothetical protein